MGQAKPAGLHRFWKGLRPITSRGEHSSPLLSNLNRNNTMLESIPVYMRHDQFEIIHGRNAKRQVAQITLANGSTRYCVGTVGTENGKTILVCDETSEFVVYGDAMRYYFKLLNQA